MPNYDKLVGSIGLVRDILVEYKQDTSTIDTISTALSNITERKSSFELAYKVDTEFIIVLYCSMVLAIVSSTSYLISCVVDFIKEPGAEDFTKVVDKNGALRSKEALLFNNLKKFNESCRKGELDKVSDHFVKNGGVS